MKIKSIKPVTLKMPFSHGGNKVIFHGKEWKELEFNLVRVETDKGIIGWGESFGYTSWKPVRTSIETMVTPSSCWKRHAKYSRSNFNFTKIITFIWQIRNNNVCNIRCGNCVVGRTWKRKK